MEATNDLSQDNALEQGTANEMAEQAPSLQGAFDQGEVTSFEEAFAQYGPDCLKILQLEETLGVKATADDEPPFRRFVKALRRLLGLRPRWNKYGVRIIYVKSEQEKQDFLYKRQLKARKKNGPRKALRPVIFVRTDLPVNYYQDISSIEPKGGEPIPTPQHRSSLGPVNLYNISEIPSMGIGSIPSTAPRATMRPMRVTFPTKKKPKPPFRAKLKFYDLGMLHPMGPIFNANYSTQLQEIGRNLERDSTYRLSITIGIRMAGRAYTTAEMNQTNLPAGGVLQDRAGNRVTPNQALQNRASFILQQIAANVTDPTLRRSILSGRSPRINITFNRNTANGPLGADIQAVR